ncbi:aryl-sulfate sulfotransferase [uncultured Maribacter sp.]|uniref:aryl-sulfate sulfotransferase n=1 Tax=uncultured Maribacter sp. TaxID=431308 RepID=UPI002603539D|nr:aryl-sulfate sulfotransferase [uncultured Maribacter sp.]
MKKLLFFAFLGLIFVACENDDVSSSEMEDFDSIDELVIDLQTEVNPSGYAPLSATVSLKTEVPVSVSLRVIGKNGEDSDVIVDFPEIGNTLEIPVHGLYPDYENEVELSFHDSNNIVLSSQVVHITTPALISAMPQIEINTANRSQMAAGMTMVNYYGYDTEIHPFRPFIFDSYGDIRWYLNYKEHPFLNNLHFDNGPHRLANGNFYFGNNEPDAIYEVDLFGTIVNTWTMPGYIFHHEVLEKPNGNFIVLVDKQGANTIEDYIIEIDRSSNQIITIWDLNESLDNSRTILTTNSEDWIHVNAVSYDANDDTIVISGRTQGVVKLNNANEVVWILAPHVGWQTAGNGADLSSFLLQPLDATGTAITSTSILDGSENHPDFEWNWYQHATKVLADGSLILFDNGDNRNFTGTGPYSRAVHYQIDETNGTVQQVWEYGKERGEETYSRIVSDVDYLAASDHILFSPGAILTGAQPFGKSIEIDMAGSVVLFEATIIPPRPFANQITFHRTERLLLYPDL